MTPLRLIETLAKEIRRETSNFTLQAEYQPDKKVAVYEGYIPVENFNNETYFPFIVVEVAGVEDGEDYSVATIRIILAVYGGENAKYGGGRELKSGFKDYGDGWRDLMNLAEVLRQYFMRLPDGFVDKTFRLIKPVAFVPRPDQPIPFYYGEMVAQFEVGHPPFPLDYPAEFEESHVGYKEPKILGW